MTTIADFTVRTADGGRMALADHGGKVLLIVNTASKCGFTPQYAGLEALHRRYAGEGLVVLGFPCNQFAGQEPGDAAEIARFCSLTYDVTFPVLARIDVNGASADPLFKWLRSQRRGLFFGDSIKWNFTKFLVARDGSVAARHGPAVTPEQLTGEIEALLRQPVPGREVHADVG